MTATWLLRNRRNQDLVDRRQRIPQDHKRLAATDFRSRRRLGDLHRQCRRCARSNRYRSIGDPREAAAGPPPLGGHPLPIAL
jgi:hypothetical protein